MSTNVNLPADIEPVRGSPELPTPGPAIPQTAKALIDQRSTAHRRPNPADGVPMPKNIRFFA